MFGNNIVPRSRSFGNGIKRSLDELAGFGVNGDEEIIHVTPGERVLPPSIAQDPQVMLATNAAFKASGMDPSMYVVGDPRSQRNPYTQLSMYATLLGNSGLGHDTGERAPPPPVAPTPPTGPLRGYPPRPPIIRNPIDPFVPPGPVGPVVSVWPRNPPPGQPPWIPPGHPDSIQALRSQGRSMGGAWAGAAQEGNRPAPATGQYDDSDSFSDFAQEGNRPAPDRKSTRLNSSHVVISYAVFCLKKKKKQHKKTYT